MRSDEIIFVFIKINEDEKHLNYIKILHGGIQNQ